MLVATIAFAAVSTIIKSLDHLHVFQVAFFRSVITSMICMGILVNRGISLRANLPGKLVMRSLIGLTAMLLYFLTLQRAPMGAAVSLKYLSPIFTAIFAVLLLKEQLRSVQWLYFLLAFGGVFLLKGFDSRLDLATLLMGIGGAIFSGLVYVIIRHIGERDHPLVIVNYYMFISSVICGIAMIFYWTAPTPGDWISLGLVGFVGYFAQTEMTKAFQVEAASRVAPVKYMEFVYAILIGYLWFGEGYGWLAALGMGMIIAGMLLNLLTKSAQ